MSSDSSDSKDETLSIEAENRFKGHEPREPELNYYKNDPAIESLIKMRMAGSMNEETLTLRHSATSKINKNNVVKIEAVMKKMGIKPGNGGINASIKNQVEEEARQYFEYHIEFPR